MRDFKFSIFFQNKVTEKFKRPFKKRHSSVYHQPSNRVNKFLSQAIEARSVDREKSAHVNRVTLTFRESEKEKSYHQDFGKTDKNKLNINMKVAINFNKMFLPIIDFGFTFSMVTSLLLLILSAGLQVCYKLI